MKLDKKTIIIVIILGILSITTLLLQTSPVKNWLHSLGTKIPTVATSITEKEPELPRPVRMVFVGDIMMTRGVESSVNKNYSGDFSKLFTQILPSINSADIAFANLEGAVSDIGNNVGSKYSFRMNPKILPVLKNIGFDIVSFANNHVGDWNVTAFNDTRARLDAEGILYTGAGNNREHASQVKIIEKNGMKIGFLAFSDVGPNWIAATETNPGILLASDPNRLSIISNAKSQVNFLVVSYHWGDEYKPFNQRQKTLAESSVDAGADLIIGHHPHVIQDYTEYKGKLIFYSLGNFIFDQSWSPETMRGLIADVTINPDGTFNTVTLQTSEQDKTYKIVELREFDRETDAILKPNDKKIVCPQPKDPNQENKWLYPVSQDLGLGNYIPSKLQPIPKTIPVRGASIQCLTSETITALEKMITDAKKVNLSIIVSSAYRSAGIQQTLFSNNQTNNPNQLYPSVAKPEHSEHQLGTALDFRSGSDVAFTLEAFGGSPEYAWLAEHARDYGFVRSYPDGKESITGYRAEPWHWRYVGVDHALAITSTDITPYEYLKSLQ